jgi:hypothetical protein
MRTIPHFPRLDTAPAKTTPQLGVSSSTVLEESCLTGNHTRNFHSIPVFRKYSTWHRKVLVSGNGPDTNFARFAGKQKYNRDAKTSLDSLNFFTEMTDTHRKLSVTTAESMDDHFFHLIGRQLLLLTSIYWHSSSFTKRPPTFAFDNPYERSLVDS